MRVSSGNDTNHDNIVTGLCYGSMKVAQKAVK